MDFYYLDLAEARLAGAFLLAETGRLAGAFLLAETGRLLLIATAFLRAGAGRLTILEAALTIFFTFVAICLYHSIDSLGIPCRGNRSAAGPSAGSGPAFAFPKET